MELKFIPLDYSYFDYEGKNYAKVIGRDSIGRRVCIIDSCDVYFWAILKDGLSKKKINSLIGQISKIKLSTKGRESKIERVELHKKKFLEKEVQALKIFVTNYKDLHDIADRLGMEEIFKRRGYDLGYITHYIIEREFFPLRWYDISGEILNNSLDFGGIDSIIEVDLCIKLNSLSLLKKEPKFSPKTLAYDIEADELKIGEGEIIMVSLVGSDGFKKVISWKKLPKSEKTPKYVEYVSNEADLLKRFVEIIKEYSPDILVGYFSDGFDLPYLKARAEKHKIKLALGIDGSQPRFFRGNVLTGKIEGIVHVDLLRFIRTVYAQYMKSETLSLNEVASEFLGDKKKEFKIKHSSELSSAELRKYFEYNLHDSVLTLALFEKFWPDMVEFTRIIQEPLFEITRAGLSKFMENYILHNLKRFNEIPEKRPTYNQIAERRGLRVEGAFVLEPKPGLYENIVMFDFTSMHTSIIISHNISRGTLLSKKERGAYESPEIFERGKKVRYYFSKKPGFFPELLKEIFELRRKFKEEYKKNPNPITKARSNAFKVLSASAHGYVAFFGARYYSHEASASILAFVRKFNKEIIEKVEKNGFITIYGDTDSIAFLRGDKSKKEIKEFLKKLNSGLPGVMHLELEDFYKRGLWVTTRGGGAGAKKKYALLKENGEIKIRGFESVRRDWCALSREVQNNIIRTILEDGNEKRALDHFKRVAGKLKKREIKKEELIIKTQLKKPLSEYKAITPHVIAARKMKEKGIPVSGGNLISYYIAQPKDRKKSKLVRERVKLPDETGEYDVEYYLENQLVPAVENIFQVFGINIKKVVKESAQKTLSDF